jgi:hypothetical protein
VPGRRITVRGTDGIERTYLLDASSLLPENFSVNQEVIVDMRTVGKTKAVRRVVYPEIVIWDAPKWIRFGMSSTDEERPWRR